MQQEHRLKILGLRVLCSLPIRTDLPLSRTVGASYFVFVVLVVKPSALYPLG